MYYLDKLLSILARVGEYKPFRIFQKASYTLTHYFILPLLALFLAWQGYKYLEFRCSHTLVEATIEEHVWDNDFLVLHYSYRIDGVSYDGYSGTYGKEISHRRTGRGAGMGKVIDRKSADTMADEYPVGSKHQIYYQDNKPEITQFAY